MNEDAKEFLKLALLSIIPSMFFFEVLAILAVMWGCNSDPRLATRRYSDTGFVFEDQNGVQIVCHTYWQEQCGMTASKCDDGLQRHCLTNVKIRKVEP